MFHSMLSHIIFQLRKWKIVYDIQNGTLRIRMNKIMLELGDNIYI